ncbi:hypothetical protein Apa02nite_020220 [Actinoplanes palleronii]|uniref:Uncharacterized protein n=1 Tax=Actinoplanes palleronii TaxID=113570 RepID=A0ABQ4B5F5_9ACTN|nr:hypothetical protein Apa02nite_020220 [Actinoplanes palleronii]
MAPGPHHRLLEQILGLFDGPTGEAGEEIADRRPMKGVQVGELIRASTVRPAYRCFEHVCTIPVEEGMVGAYFGPLDAELNKMYRRPSIAFVGFRSVEINCVPTCSRYDMGWAGRRLDNQIGNDAHDTGG